MKSNIRRFYSTLFILFFCFVVGGSVVQASGFGVSPKALSVSMNENGEAVAEIYVHNTEKKTARFLVVPDDYSQLIKANPESFQLKPGESVQVSLAFKKIPHGDYASFISVISEEILEQGGGTKTGVKIPLDLQVFSSNSYSQINYSILILGFLLLALALFVLAFIRYRNLSFFAKIIDTLREVFSRRSFKKSSAHYINYHRLLVISLVSLLVALILLIVSFVSPNRYGVKVKSLTNNNESLVSLSISTPDKGLSYTLPLLNNKDSVFNVLKRASEIHGFSYDYNPPQEMGVLVTEIAGHKNGKSDKYWLYEVNGQYIPIAADRYFLSPGDHILWKYVIPE